jgi:hypothetical protein
MPAAFNGPISIQSFWVVATLTRLIQDTAYRGRPALVSRDRLPERLSDVNLTQKS